MNTEAIFTSFEENVLNRTTKGDASESGLIKFLEPIIPVVKTRENARKIFTCPFNSTNKWMASVVR